MEIKKYFKVIQTSRLQFQRTKENKQVDMSTRNTVSWGLSRARLAVAYNDFKFFFQMK